MVGFFSRSCFDYLHVGFEEFGLLWFLVIVEVHSYELLSQTLFLCIYTIQEEVAEVVKIRHWKYEVFCHGGPLLRFRELELLTQPQNLLVTVRAQLVIILLQVADDLFVCPSRRHQLFCVVLQDAVTHWHASWEAMSTCSR